ncbi:protein of unknown function DUF502 [Oleidesulfovibrio alaskensis G20]|uniref:DUF502 domain-containing protein n=1 Tax=Oleidesulfovibrio alaskensis (strain ATCC BAA-1058 / DSM 17464 / G20) TaxID=207559 RepID=Q311V0_OLEA2|nr:DUF502 domain-containing protein [Oleidesulfovibrio alaskensis]ABB38296.1 protein of unknown function DUF502 [Oleidesulfovibrio alaskensis G20]
MTAQDSSGGFMALLRRFIKANLFAGILVLTPLVATFLTLRVAVRWVDKLLLLLPPQYRPEAFLPFAVPGLGFLLLIVVLLVTGLLVRNFLGRRLVDLGDAILARIPLVSSLYSGIKQLVETIFTSSRDFQRVVLIEYPRKGLYTMAFVTGVAVGEIQSKTASKVLNVFVPTTPNPTSGFYLMVPEADVIPLEMNVEDAFKLLISGGILSAEHEKSKNRKKKTAIKAKNTSQEETHDPL